MVTKLQFKNGFLKILIEICKPETGFYHEPKLFLVGLLFSSTRFHNFINISIGAVIRFMNTIN